MRRLVFIACVFAAVVVFPAFAKTTRIGEKICQQPGYYCFTVAKGETWENILLDEKARDLVRRVNRLNIRLREGMIIAIPERLNEQSRESLAPFPAIEATILEKTVVFDHALLAWGAYDQTGKLVAWGPASGGKGWCPDINEACSTPVGEYRVYSKGGADCKSNTFPIPDGGAPMPYCMFFHGGYALHGSSEVPGYHASHGCVRMYAIDAKWLSENFIERGTRVIIR